MQRDGELGAVICHALVDRSDLIVGLEVGAMSVFRSAIVLCGRSAELLEAIGMLFFECGAFLEEACKLL